MKMYPSLYLWSSETTRPFAVHFSLNYCRLNYWLFELLVVWTIARGTTWSSSNAHIGGGGQIIVDKRETLRQNLKRNGAKRQENCQLLVKRKTPPHLILTFAQPPPLFTRLRIINRKRCPFKLNLIFFILHDSKLMFC